VEERLRARLDRHAARVERVRVSLSDVNGPRGGIDQRCALHAEVRGTAVLASAAVAGDLHGAIAEALARLRAALARALSRQRNRRKRPRRVQA
jgi:ribosome-associated translation inhibitor RaiA